MPFFENQDINFFYEIEGEGFPFLFIHGLGGSIEANKYIIEKLKDVQKIYMDMRGHGRTYPLGPKEHLNFKQFSEDAHNLINHLNIKKIIMGGISMGSAVSIRFALRFPKLVKNLILIRPAWLNKKNPGNLHFFKLVSDLIKNYSPHEAVDHLSRNPEFKNLKGEYPAAAESLTRQIFSEKAREYYYRLVAMPSSVPYNDPYELNQLKTRTLIIGTEQDPIHPFTIAKELADQIPNATLYKVISKSENLNMHINQIKKIITNFISEI
ncbi:MAG TPA: alpha/beta hydrolase [Anaerolineae bacterium]|nr:alpha/beta hydrolase [Anaerolineae bacterium]